MNVKDVRSLALIPWLSLPITLAGYFLLWNRMPPQIGVHFTFSGIPVTSVSRAQSLLFNLMTLLLVLSVCSWRIWTGNVNLKRILVRYYFAIVTLTIIFLGILLYNIYHPIG
jgi:hypothetical protein